MTRIHTHKESGFSLVEMILVVGLLSGIMVVLTVLLQDYMRREQTHAIADYMALTQRAVKESTDTMEEFNALYTAAQANGNVIEISILDPNNPNRTVGYTPAGGLNLETGGAGLQPNNIINAGYDPAAATNYSMFRDTLPLRASNYRTGIDGPADNARRDARLTVLAKIVDNPGITTDERAMEILITTVDRIAERDLRDIARDMKAPGGLVSAATDENLSAHCPAGNCATMARSAFGNWYSTLSGYAGTRWYNSVFAANPATLEDGGYLVSYLYLNEAMLAGDYLYRTAVPGSPELNRMNTALNLGGNNIIGADNVEIVPPAGSTGPALTVDQNIYAQGSAYVHGDLNVRGDMIVTGDMRAQTLSVQPGYNVNDAAISPGTRPVYGSVVVEDVFNTSTMTTSGDFSADNAEMANLSAGETSSLDLTIGSTLNVTGSLYTGVIQGGTTSISGQMRAGQIQASTVNASSAGVVQGETSGDLSVTGTTQQLTTGKYSSGGPTYISNLVACRLGC